MATQMHPRISKRMPCSIETRDQRHTGLVLNVSQGGLFVQTNAAPGRGEAVELELNAPEAERSIPVQGKVVWQRVVPHQLRSMARGGVGLRIQNAPESYYVLLARWMRTELPVPNREGPLPEPSKPEPQVLSWRVRVRAVSGPRTRMLTIEAPTLEAARSEAQRYAGDDWRIIEIDPV